LSARHYAIVQLIDLCCASPIAKAEFPAEASNGLMGIFAYVARVALSENLLSLYRNPGALALLESLIELSTGWSELKGTPGEQVKEKFNSSLLGLSLLTDTLSKDATIEGIRDYLVTLLQKDIASFTSSEKQRTKKLEQRLIDTEAGHFRTAQSRNLAAKTLSCI